MPRASHSRRQFSIERERWLLCHELPRWCQWLLSDERLTDPTGFAMARLQLLRWLRVRLTTRQFKKDTSMARRYSRASGKKVRRAMREMKRGKLRSGRSRRRVRSRKQAIAIGLSEARRAGNKVPRKRGS